MTRKGKGYCFDCNKPIKGKNTRCRHCQDNDNARTHRFYNKRLALRQEGKMVCHNCKKVFTDGYGMYCNRCRKVNRLRQNNYRARNRYFRCPCCGNILDEYAILTKKLHCDNCNSKQTRSGI